jgi:hypothetical protein
MRKATPVEYKVKFKDGLIHIGNISTVIDNKKDLN